MKMKYWFIAWVVLSSLSLRAQEKYLPWTFSASGGPVFRFPNEFGPELNAILNERYPYPQFAGTLALEMSYELNDRLSAGAAMWWIWYPPVMGDFAEVNLKGVAGQLKGYYHAISTDQWNLKPYLGLGYYRTQSAIDNTGFLVNRPPLYIPPGSNQTIYGGLVFMDIGAQLYIMSSEDIMWGFAVGYQGRITGSSWEASWGEAIDALSPPRLSLLYLRLSLAIKR